MGILFCLSNFAFVISETESIFMHLCLPCSLSICGEFANLTVLGFNATYLQLVIKNDNIYTCDMGWQNSSWEDCVHLCSLNNFWQCQYFPPLLIFGFCHLSDASLMRLKDFFLLFWFVFRSSETAHLFIFCPF